jgi:mRNA-degrading endonuclease toxin of MazEF toxin-antitoxin module
MTDRVLLLGVIVCVAIPSRASIAAIAPSCGLIHASKVLLDQIRTVDKRRLSRRMGSLSSTGMQAVDVAVRLSLSV